MVSCLYDFKRLNSLRNCSAGTYAAERGALFCTKCPVGTYASHTGEVGCTTCAAGRYQVAQAQTKCIEW